MKTIKEILNIENRNNLNIYKKGINRFNIMIILELDRCKLKFVLFGYLLKLCFLVVEIGLLAELQPVDSMLAAMQGLYNQSLITKTRSFNIQN